MSQWEQDAKTYAVKATTYAVKAAEPIAALWPNGSGGVAMSREVFALYLGIAYIEGAYATVRADLQSHAEPKGVPEVGPESVTA